MDENTIFTLIDAFGRTSFDVARAMALFGPEKERTEEVITLAPSQPEITRAALELFPLQAEGPKSLVGIVLGFKGPVPLSSRVLERSLGEPRAGIPLAPPAPVSYLFDTHGEDFDEQLIVSVLAGHEIERDPWLVTALILRRFPRSGR